MNKNQIYSYPQNHLTLSSPIGTAKSGSGKTAGGAAGAATFIATANPAGLIVSSGMNVYGETTGKSNLESRAKATAREIAKVLQKGAREQGRIN